MMLMPSESSVLELIQQVRAQSAYYKKLYVHLPEDVSDIEQLPLTDIDEFWKACGETPHGVMMGPFNDGIVMRSGGSTAAPKLTYATPDELRRASQILGVGLSHFSGMVPGDRIANMMRHGSMYGGFAYANSVLLEMPLPHVHLPITGNELPQDAYSMLSVNDATVIMSNVFTAVRLADWCRTNEKSLPKIRLVLYTGEAFYKDLRPLFKTAFPNAKVHPSMYACVDSGLIGIPAHPPMNEDDDINPVYRSAAPFSILELIAEDGTVIREPGKRGHVYVTHLVKKKVPMMRYPVGDIAEWVDCSQGTFRLYGRDNVNLKVGTAHLDLPTLRALMERAMGSNAIDSFQTIIRRERHSNTITFRIAGKEPENSEAIRRMLEGSLAMVIPSWTRNRELGHIGPIQLEFVEMKDLVVNEKTLKLKPFIEERFGEDGVVPTSGTMDGSKDVEPSTIKGSNDHV
jgi:phenylacetate-CoA ligase